MGSSTFVDWVSDHSLVTFNQDWSHTSHSFPGHLTAYHHAGTCKYLMLSRPIHKGYYDRLEYRIRLPFMFLSIPSQRIPSQHSYEKLVIIVIGSFFQTKMVTIFIKLGRRLIPLLCGGLGTNEIMLDIHNLYQSCIHLPISEWYFREIFVNGTTI